MMQGAYRFNQWGVQTWDLSNAQFMGRMFYATAQFNQDLCELGPHLTSLVEDYQMFSGTSCPAQGDLDLNADPVSPLCHPC